MLTVPYILLSITALSNIGLALFIRSRNRTSSINFYFALFAVFLAFWAVILILYSVVDGRGTALYLMKSSYFAALMIGVSFYCFSIVFPEDKRLTLPEKILAFVPAAIFALCLFGIPQFLTHDIVRHPWGKETTLGSPEFISFAILFVYLFVGGLIRIWIKCIHARGQQRLQLLAIGSSVTVAGFLGIYFNLVLPSPYLQDFRYIWTGPLFTFLIAMVITYSIFRFKFFNPRAIVSEFLVYALFLLLFIRLLLSESVWELTYSAIMLLAVSVVGVLIVRSVAREVEQRELIEKQERDLTVANQKQETLLHFISHEIKGYLTKNEAAFDAIRVGDYGETTAQLKDMASAALTDTRKGVATVIDILDASNLKKGTVQYEKKEFDLVAAVDQVVKDLAETAQEKGLHLIFHRPVSGAYTFVGDQDKIRRHVIRNIIDNSVKYTPTGEVVVDLAKTDSVYRITVRDTGVGITLEDMTRLFTEGGHGKNSIKVNVHSTGYGLFIAKQIVEAHGGKVWAESDGAGTGSRFIVELPHK